MDVQSASPGFKKVHWTEAEDAILFDYVKQHGEGKWSAVAKATGLARCGKSCRHRWLNHLKPNLKKGPITPDEEELIIQLQAKMGNKWARIVKHLPGRTDNEIKNYWNCKMKRFKSQRVGVVPLPSPPPVLDPSNVQQQQQQQQNEYSPLVELSLPRLVARECRAPIVPRLVPDIVGHYLHSGAIGEAMEIAVGMLQSRGIRIPNSLLQVPAPSPLPMMDIVSVDPQASRAPFPTMAPIANVDSLVPLQLQIASAGDPAPSPSPMMDIVSVNPQASWASLPTMTMVNNVDPLAPPQLPIISVGDPAPFPSPMMAMVNVDPQASWAPLPTMTMVNNMDPLAPPQLPIVSMGDPAPLPSPMMAMVNVDPQASWAPLPTMTMVNNMDPLAPPQLHIVSVDDPAPLPSPMMAMVNVDPQASWASLPTMTMVNNVDPLAPPQLPIAGVDHPTPPSLSMPPTVGVDDLDFDFDIDMDMVQSILARDL